MMAAQQRGGISWAGALCRHNFDPIMVVVSYSRTREAHRLLTAAQLKALNRSMLWHGVAVLCLVC